VNLVADPSFEHQAYPTLGSPWQGQATIETGTTTATTAARGNKAALIRADSGWNPIQQWIAIKPFTHYRASVAVESSDNLTDAYFSVRGSSTFQVLNQVPFGTVGSSVYRTLRFEFDTGNDTSVLLYVGMWAHAPGTWLRVDDLNVFETPSVVTNGAFEGASAGWQITGNSSIDHVSPHTGTGALVLSGTSGWTSVNQWIPVAKNMRYRAGAWVRTSATAIDGWFSVRGGGAFDVINQVHYGAMSGDYRWITFDFDSGPNISVLLYIGFWGQGTPSFVEIDDVSVANAAPLTSNYEFGNYGFLAHFDCTETEQTARDRIDAMVSRFHVTDVQFYDWFASYQNPTSGTSWTDPWFHSRSICLQTIKWYIDELHRDGARAWAYVQSVASESFGLATPASGVKPLLHNGKQWCMAAPMGVCTGAPGEHPTYLDNAAWADHQVAVWGTSVAALEFDGIHWDTLGSLADDKAAELSGVHAFLREAAPQLAKLHLMQTMNFVSMNWWAPSLLDVVSFIYSEAWSTADQQALYNAMGSAAMQERGGVLAFYPSTPDPNNQESAMLTRWSDAPNHQVRYLIVGDGTRRLVNEYFPDNVPLSPSEIIALSQ
jgi:hypothetical protein